jgi:hypothetical protein
MADFANSIHDVGHRVATYKHLELVIASTLSRWVDIISEPNACALVGSHAHIHADHAQLWDSRIPLLWDHEASRWNSQSLSDLASVVSQIGEDTTFANTQQRLEAMYNRVLPALLQTYSAHLATIDPRVDPATAHILQTCVNNTRDHIDQAHDVIARIASAS